MAKIKELTVGTARKMGLPGYSSFDVSAFVTVSLENGDLPADAYKRAWEIVEKQVIDRIKAKGLESPVAAEAQKPENPNDWLEHQTPEEQKFKIKAAKRLEEVQQKLKPVSTIPSIKPSMRGGEY